VQRASAKLQRILAILVPVSVLLAGGASFAQSADENIKPVSSVCLSGQACVGTTAGGAGRMSTAPAPAAAPVAASPAPAVIASAEPAAPAATGFDAAAAYQMSCFACHATGAAGAPKVGDKAAWTARLEKGMDAVMVNATNGLNAMPPKGMCMTCSADDLRAIVDYMVSQ
jgi:cytochrome c5